MQSHNDILIRCGATTRKVTDRIVKHYYESDHESKEHGRIWYPNAFEIVKELSKYTGCDKKSASAIAHLSPRTPWKRNVDGAFELVKTGRLKGHMSRNVNGAILALNSNDPLSTLTGSKTKRFALNILGDVNSVTVDVWALRVAFETPNERVLNWKGGYEAVERCYNLASKRTGETPRDLQAITWCHIRGTEK